jgi:hypothetical protein
MTLIPQKLIEKALALTSKTIEDMYAGNIWQYEVEWNFSYQKFFYYLLSPEFIEKYDNHIKQDFIYIDGKKDIYRLFWQAIWEYQSWDSDLIIWLLSKI